MLIMWIKIKYIQILSYFYLMVPIILFFLGWMKLLLGLICTIILLIGFFALYKQDYKTESEIFKLSYFQLAIILVGIFVFVWLSGAGGFFVQTGDNNWRNAIFRDLINYSWPIKYDNNNTALVYYFIHWLVPALGGKLFGWLFGNIFLFLWDFTGIFLSSLVIIHLTKAYSKLSKIVIGI